MRAIAVGEIFGVSALANGVEFFSWGELYGAVWSSLVRAITEWLILRESTCAVPIILANFQLDSTS